MTSDPTHLALAVERQQPGGYHWILLDGSLEPHEYVRLLEGDQSFSSYPEAFQAGLGALLKLAAHGEGVGQAPRAGFSAPV
ncbi:hypothetical protein GT347_05070 [Xylophilus rhododendri]|uniref:Uncharacterized protein n=1 Tax=Xylophilus rhododendri TaxID=2697032 RepID=A0A857J0M3_9BURK|nr:hypothetical protein [Xylophilus rhododendri]QHI97410.1 hypothetical protein GT347_05070 [Xylophilus rhododendri]